MLAENLDNPELLAGIQSIKAEVTEHYDSREYGKAIRLIMSQADKANQYIKTKNPGYWQRQTNNPSSCRRFAVPGLMLSGYFFVT